MRYLSMFLLTAAVSSLPASAHVSPTHEAPQPPKEQLIQTLQDGRRLFFGLTREQSLLGPKTLEFRIRLDGRPYLIETLSLPPFSQEESPVFELLAPLPAVLEDLRRLAEEHRRIRLQVFLDGSRIGDLSFQELLRQNLDAPSWRQAAREAPSSIRGFARGTLPAPEGKSGLRSITAAGVDPACVSNCDALFTQCAQSQCGGVYCEECAAEHQSCVDACPCTDPKNSYTYQSSANYSLNNGSFCLYIMSYQHSHWHIQTKYWTVTTTRQRTEYCDGTYQDVPISSSSSTPVYCYQDTGIDCFPSQGTFFGCHY